MQVPTSAGLAEWREAADTAADAVVASHVDGDRVPLLRGWRREGAPTVNLEERSGWVHARRLLRDLSNDPPIVARIGARRYAQTGARWCPRKPPSMLDHDLRDALPRVLQPTLVIRGDEDRVVPAAWAPRVRDPLPDGELRIARGTGHEAMVTGAEPVARMVPERSA